MKPRRTRVVEDISSLKAGFSPFYPRFRPSTGGSARWQGACARFWVDASRSAVTREFLEALRECETLRAIRALDALDRATWQEKSDGVPFKDAWEGFTHLMDRRGFFVSSPQKLAESLAQIRELGEGFDLYEVARKMAALDTIVTECLRLRPRRMFPELREFSPPCPCGNHPGKKEDPHG